MSNVGGPRSASRSSKQSHHDIPTPPPPQPATTPQWDGKMEPCAASASFFLYGQRNVILCLHHDTLAIERRFERHQDDVAWIVIDNVSDVGAGRLVVSYDIGQIAIVWDLMTGDEVARFESFEDLRSAAWMKNGNVAFGNSTGNIILFEPSTKEHLSTKTIYDPVTALAPAMDNHTFAIGYQNGSIMIARLQPRFDILHMPHSRLQTERSGSVVHLAWHGSSAKQKSDMLGSQTADGDILIWSIPKAPHGETATVIRELGKFQGRGPSQCWFGWSKTGRIVQYQEAQTQTHDVRTKKIVSLVVPTIDNVIGMCNFGPGATLFTIGRGHTVQQYDISPNGNPQMVAHAHHVLSNLPPSPPNSIEEQKEEEKHRVSGISGVSGASMPVFLDAMAGAEEHAANEPSPLAKIVQQRDSVDMDELRDQVPPLASPGSSKSSVSTRSSSRRSERSESRAGGSHRSRHGERRQKQPSIYSNQSATQSETTFFSGGSTRSGSHRTGTSVSTRSVSSSASSRHGGSRLRHQVLRSPEEQQAMSMLDLFPYAKARLADVPFTSPRYEGLSVDDLRVQMLSIVFGWEDDIEDLIRDERSRHKPGSASSVLLAKWVGEDSEADIAAQMLGSDSMTSMDWMFLALSSMGNSQKKVAETFVERLLEKGDVHPAVAILIGLGETSDAIEVYVSRRYYIEAILLTCLIYPRDWQRISHLVRRWGEIAVAEKRPELAVRCFSCTSMEASDAYLSPRAQDAAYAAQQAHIMGSMSPPLSPPDSSAGPRIKNTGLKLVTNFEKQQAANVTPIDGLSAMTPGGPHLRSSRPEPSTAGASARTATPGGFARKRFPSRSAVERIPTSDATPLAATSRSAFPSAKNQSGRSESRHSRAHSLSSAASMSSDRLPVPESNHKYTISSPSKYDVNAPKQALPSPAHGIFDNYQTRARSRNGSRTRKPDGLSLDMYEKVVEMGPETGDTGYRTTATEATSASRMTAERIGLGSITSPPLTGASNISAVSLASTKVRAIDNYISSLQEANFYAQQQRVADKRRATSRSRDESRNRTREPSQDTEVRPREPRGRSGVRYIKSSKRSPSSPVSMSPDDPALQVANQTFDDENFYRVTSPVEARGRSDSKARGTSKHRSSSKTSKRAESPRSTRASRPQSKVKIAKSNSRLESPDRLPPSGTRGRSLSRGEGSLQRSPSSPLPMSSQTKFYTEDDFDAGAGGSDEERADRQRSRNRQRSTSRRAGPRAGSARRESSPDRHRPRDRSTSRHPGPDVIPEVSEDESPQRWAPKASTRTASRSRLPRVQTSNLEQVTIKSLTQKERAAKELEERRLSLARRPSAPQIPHPDQIEKTKSPLSSRSPLHESLSPAARIQHSHSPMSAPVPLSTVAERGYRPEFPKQPETNVVGTSTSSVPIGLPATPRAMRHPKYMTADPKEGEAIPAIPEIPANFAQAKSEDVKQEAEDAPLLLPATTYSAANTPRSASVPAESPFSGQRPGSFSGNNADHWGHVRKFSSGGTPMADVVASIDEAISDSRVVIIEEPAQEADPPLLPELQHLAGPPPPPPPPVPFQRMNSAPSSVAEPSPLDRRATPAAMTSTSGTSNSTTPAPEFKPSHSPQAHRRGRGSVSESVGKSFRNVRDRMRSTSRNRVRSPPNDELTSFTPSPYESVLPPVQFPGHSRKDSLGRTTSPPSQLQMTQFESVMPSMAGGEPPGSEPASKSNTPFQGYRNPKEIRANMPPDHLQSGVYHG